MFFILIVLSLLFIRAASINLDWIYPTSDINVSQNNWFNITVNVSCTNGDCGEINVTLDPTTSTIKILQLVEIREEMDLIRRNVTLIIQEQLLQD